MNDDLPGIVLHGLLGGMVARLRNHGQRKDRSAGGLCSRHVAVRDFVVDALSL